jgi:hypothetical protein
MTIAYLVDFVTDVLLLTLSIQAHVRRNQTNLQISTNVTKQRNVANAGDHQKKQRADEHDNGEERRHGEGRYGEGVALEIFRNVIPIAIFLLCEVDAPECESIDGLSRTFSE